MIDYVIILFAVVCFAGQFAFTKLYEGEVGQTATGSLCMLMGSNLVGVLLFLCRHVSFCILKYASGPMIERTKQ